MLSPFPSVWARSRRTPQSQEQDIAPKDSLSFGCLSPFHAWSPPIIPAGLIESNAWKLNPIEEIKCVGVILAEAFGLNRSLLQRSHWPGRITWDTATRPSRPSKHSPPSSQGWDGEGSWEGSGAHIKSIYSPLWIFTWILKLSVATLPSPLPTPNLMDKRGI